MNAPQAVVPFRPCSGTVRVLVVDDSAFMRNALAAMLKSEPCITVVGSGRNGAEAVCLADELKPDVITLDLEMPVMDGLEALRVIMAHNPTPILMLSSYTAPGAEATLKALELGASDFLVKPGSPTSPDVGRMRDDLVARVLALACRHAGPRCDPAAPPLPPLPTARAPRRLAPGGLRLVVIGASTGGPRALQRLLGELPADLDAAVLIVQHMPRLFTSQFARRLDETGGLRVHEATQGARVGPGEALLAPGDAHLEVSHVGAGHAVVRLSQEPATAAHRPSVDVLFESAARLNARRTVGLVLTGMGTDGCDGMRKLHEAGGVTLAQDEQSCVVYGMPRACVEAEVVDRVVSLDEAARSILEALGSRAPRGTMRKAS